MKSKWCGVFVGLMLVAAASTVFAQPGRGGFSFGGGGDLLRSDAVIEELELVPEQQEKIQAARDRGRDATRELFSGFREMSDEERQEAFAEIRKIQAKVEDEIKDVMLPQQRERYAQIQFQSQLRRGRGGSLTGRAVVEALDITDEQLEKMRAKEAEVREELTKRIQAAEEDARKELLSVLDPAQRRKYEELTKDTFEFPQRQGFQGGPGGGRQGFQGGNNGGRQGFQGRRGNRGGGNNNRPQRPET